jgi:hypothetical protein
MECAVETARLSGQNMGNISRKAGSVHDIRLAEGEFSLTADVAWLAAVEIAPWFHYGG